jgi:hypothetical protein
MAGFKQPRDFSGRPQGQAALRQLGKVEWPPIFTPGLAPVAA